MLLGVGREGVLGIRCACSGGRAGVQIRTAE